MLKQQPVRKWGTDSLSWENTGPSKMQS